MNLFDGVFFCNTTFVVLRAGVVYWEGYLFFWEGCSVIFFRGDVICLPGDTFWLTRDAICATDDCLCVIDACNCFIKNIFLLNDSIRCLKVIVYWLPDACHWGSDNCNCFRKDVYCLTDTLRCLSDGKRCFWFICFFINELGWQTLDDGPRMRTTEEDALQKINTKPARRQVLFGVSGFRL